MRILLVMPTQVEKAGDYYEFSMGILYISAVLKKENFDVVCLNLNHIDEAIGKAIERAILSKDIDIVGTGSLSYQYNQVKHILASAKKTKKDIITIAGGGLITSEPELMIKSMQMDFGVIGEGEETIIELIRAIENQGDFSRINGIICKDKKGDIVRTPTRKAAEELDALPFPDYEGFEVEKQLDSLRPNDSIQLTFMDNPRAMTLISSRSCPFNCTFCFHPTGNKYRQRSLDSFFKELEYFVKKYELNMVEIMDELFAGDTKRVNEFCRRIKPLNLLWYAQIRADTKITPETLSMLKDSGNYIMGCGVESASDTILKSMKKHTTVAMIERILPMIKAAGIIPVSNFILGDPAETAETVRETMNWWRNHSDYDFIMNPLTPYPGTEIYKYSLENKIITDKLEFLEKGCPPVNMSREMNDFEYQRIFYQGMRFVWLTENLLRLFLLNRKVLIR